MGLIKANPKASGEFILLADALPSQDDRLFDIPSSNYGLLGFA